jgi:hypothetical protein
LLSLPALSLIALVAVLTAKADTLRVTTWNLRFLTTGSGSVNTNRLREAAAVLKKVDPDIILLQQVGGWQVCARLADALKPAAYHVLICSSFRAAEPGIAAPQTAVLSKHKGYFSWAEAWQEHSTNGGFAFVAVQYGTQRLGLFSAQFDGVSEPANSIGQLLNEVGSIRRWEANQPQVFVIAATFDTVMNRGSEGEKAAAMMKSAGFENAFWETPAPGNVTFIRDREPGVIADYIFAQNTCFPAEAQVFRSPVSDHNPVTCVLELDPAKAGAAWKARVEELERRALTQRAEELRRQATSEGITRAAKSSDLSSSFPWGWAALIGGLLACLALARYLTKRRRSRQFPLPPLLAAQSSYTIVVAPQSTTGSAASQAIVPAIPQPLFHVEPPTQTQSAAFQPLVSPAQPSQALDSALRRTLMQDLTLWLKQKLVRKLIADRSQLLEAQEAATLKAKRMDERLSRIEHQVQLQMQDYEQRIEALTCELLAAKEENRELIRARIEQVKAEMEAARAEALAKARQDDTTMLGGMP